ncbi:MAG TPA: ABC transporter ATP-binding protein [Leptospiraceae bacterium]|nr:ABC transporter ATP-binding protein [Leptospiraceae bacterium]HMW06374.1 ABC transporter ATP-binding protein [Leptospiraceae bacterium]HMX31714.1 ABC transporter ATP-binding protein [Leptospiraceae bacterium]HMY32000.1 ABC transporter ATP-binding protein [Leptospiraceae bacterium]HMZ65787.1 ABC transporter ATP-binding protein [Leptospiraceae bacterium]
MIKISNLSKSFNKNKVIHNLNLEIKEGLITALVGPNGSGKTTLLKCILGLTYPDKESRVLLSGFEYLNKNGIKEIGYMPQTPLFPQNLKVKEIIQILKNLEEKETIYEENLKDELEINKFENKYFGELSGGMKQKVNILQCFSSEKKFYIIDEPTASLDPHISFYLKNLLKERRKKGSSILFTSHIMSEVDEIADRVIVMVEGKLILDETPLEILNKSNTTNMESALRSYWMVGVNHA